MYQYEVIYVGGDTDIIWADGQSEAEAIAKKIGGIDSVSEVA